MGNCLGSLRQSVDDFHTHPVPPFEGQRGDCSLRLMEAGVHTVSEGLPGEGSHSQNVPFSSSRLVSHVPETVCLWLRRWALPESPFHLPILDLRKWPRGTFTWWQRQIPLGLVLQELALTQGTGQAE